ncbi:MAG: hypothetical protein LIO54_03775 [Oscillospiraceae bacterium]|nr:hypothetical protein [Oscillospiraceae bacterium]
MSEILRKVTSRKFLAAVAGLVTGLAMVFGLDEGVVTSVAGAVVSVSSIMTYIITEGKVDAASVAAAVESVQTAVEALDGTSSTADGAVSYTAEVAGDE